MRPVGRPMRWIALLAIQAMLLPLACSDDTQQEFSIKWTRDYTGVPVINNNDKEVPSHRTIVGARPYARINEASGGNLTVIAHVRRLSTGEILILDSANRNIAVFSSAGQFLRRIERIGDGPGEFRNIRGLRVLPGDTLLLFAPPDRLIRLHPDGSYIQQQSIPQPSPLQPTTRPGSSMEFFRLWYPSHPLRNGNVLVQSSNDPVPLKLGYSRPSTLYGIVHPGEQFILDTIGFFPGGLQNQLTERKNRPVHLSPTTSFAVGDKYLYFGDGAHYDIGQYDLEGRLLRRIQRRKTVMRVTEEDRRYYHDYLVSTRQRQVDGYEIADNHPFFYGLLADERDYLWVQQPHSANHRSQLWAVFDTTGDLVEEVTMPFPFIDRVVWIDSTSIFVARQDTVYFTPQLLMYSVTRAVER